MIKLDRIPLADLEKAMYLLTFKRSRKILSDYWIQSAKHKPSDEEECRTVTVSYVVISDPKVTFGGVNRVDLENLSRYGILGFVNIKSVRFYDAARSPPRRITNNQNRHQTKI